MEITSKNRDLHSLQNELNTIVEARKKERQMHNKELDEIQENLNICRNELANVANQLSSAQENIKELN